MSRRLLARCTLLAVTLALVGCNYAQPDAQDDVPELATGLVEQQPSVVGLGTAPEDGFNGNELVTPHTHQELRGVQVTDTLEVSTASLLGLGSGADAPRAAPDGYDIVVAEISNRDLISPFEPGDSPVTFEVVVVGEQRTELDAFGGYVYAGPPTPGFWASPDMTLVLVVPEDEPAWFAVTDEGRTARMDLRTGALAKDADTLAGSAYYLDRGAALRSEGTGAGTVADLAGAYVPLDVAVTLSYAERSFLLSPWLPVRGWAADGRLWGSAFADLEINGGPGSFVGFTGSTDAVFGLTGPDGTTYPPLVEPLEYDGLDTITDIYGSPTVGAVWDLAADFAGGTLTTTLAVTWTVVGEPATYSGAPAVVAPITFTLVD